MSAAPAIIDHEPRKTNIVSMTPMDMLNQAVSSGANIETLTKLMDLQERWEKNQARKAFDEAMAEAKSEIPVILKNRKVDFTSQKGRTNYRHEDLAEIARTVDPILAKYGLSYRFRTKTDVGSVSVTCIVSHRDGYSEENSLSAGHDQSGNKNSIQAVGSTITYLQRYTLKASLGIAASDDDDGRASGNAVADNSLINQEQAEVIRKLIDETGTDIARFCNYMNVEAVPDIPLGQYQRAVIMLEKKRGAAK